MAVKPKKEKEPSFEEELAQLETIVSGLENGNVPLVELVARYEEGMKHLKNCQAKLADAELRIEQLRSVSADGKPDTVPFKENSET